jgi:hypothetical protein
MSLTVTHTFTHTGDDWMDAHSRRPTGESFTIENEDGSKTIISNPESVFYEYPRSTFSDEDWAQLDGGDGGSVRFTPCDYDDPRVDALMDEWFPREV